MVLSEQFNFMNINNSSLKIISAQVVVAYFDLLERLGQEVEQTGYNINSIRTYQVIAKDRWPEFRQHNIHLPEKEALKIYCDTEVVHIVHFGLEDETCVVCSMR